MRGPGKAATLPACGVEQPRCELLENPLGLATAQPRFSWKLADARRGAKQTAYRVLVSLSEQSLADQRGDLWDSGRVASDENHLVAYGGKPLVSRQRCFWKVKIWDLEGRETAWSSPASFELGLLNKDDWKATWIGHAAYAERSRPTCPHHGYHSAYADGPDEQKWVSFDFGSPVAADEVMLYPVFPLFEGYYKEHWRGMGLYFPIACRIEVADNPEFRNATVVGAYADDVQRRESDFAEDGSFLGWHEENPIEEPARIACKPAKGRYLRVLATRLGGYYSSVQFERNEPKHYALALAEVKILSGGKNLAPAAKVSVSDALENSVRYDPSFVNDEQDAPLPPATLFRKQIELKKQVRRAVLYATARGVYACGINGRRVGQRRFAPGWTNYHKRYLVQAYDVTDLLKPGENAVGVTVGDGWLFGTNAGGLEAEHPEGCYHQFLGQLHVEYADGSHEVFKTDDTWKSSTEGPFRRTELYIGEIYDARREMPGWDAPGFNDHSWPSAASAPLGGEMLAMEPYQGISVAERVPCQSIVEREPGVWRLDFGRNMMGVARLRLAGRTSQKIRIQYSQELNDDGSPHTFSLCATLQRDYVLPSSDEPFVYEPQFTVHGFRYVEVRGCTEKPADAEALFLHSACETVGRFTSSNELLNRLVQAAAQTMLSNKLSVNSDSAARERTGWPPIEHFISADMFMFRNPTLYRKHIVDLCDSCVLLQADPNAIAFPMNAPPRFCDRADDGDSFVFAWQDTFLMLADQYYQHYGDRRFMEEYYPQVCGEMASLDRQCPKSLDEPPPLKGGLGDWLNADTFRTQLWTKFGYLPDPSMASSSPDISAHSRLGVDLQVFSYAWLAHDYDMAARIAAALGHADDAARWQERYKFLCDYFVRHFAKRPGVVAGETQGAYALALHFNLLPQEQTAAATANLLKSIHLAHGHMTTGFASTPAMLFELSRRGRHDDAVRLMSLDTFPSLGYMLRQGATTIWERWDGDQWKNAAYMNDFNHRDFCMFVDWVWQYVVGIRPDAGAPGFGRVVIRPAICDALRSAEGSFDSVRGKIRVAYRLGDDGWLELSATVPPNVSAMIFVPTTDPAGVLEGDRPVRESPGVRSTCVEGRELAVEVLSGTYHFKSRLPPPKK